VRVPAVGDQAHEVDLDLGLRLVQEPRERLVGLARAPEPPGERFPRHAGVLGGDAPVGARADGGQDALGDVGRESGGTPGAERRERRLAGQDGGFGIARVVEEDRLPHIHTFGVTESGVNRPEPVLLIGISVQPFGGAAEKP
jgi:hypothetical protein